jgi:ATPase subunit of ABC transporter with duplicated ATPase domains
LEEPENHLDLEAITSLNKALVSFAGNLIFTTHDHEIYSTVANRIIQIKEGVKVFDHHVSYDEYLDLILKNA